MPHPPVAASSEAAPVDIGSQASVTEHGKPQDQVLEYLQAALDTKTRKRGRLVRDGCNGNVFLAATPVRPSVPAHVVPATSSTGGGDGAEQEPLAVRPPPLPGGSVAGFRKRDTRFVPVRDSLKKSECFKTTPGSRAPPAPGRSVSKGPLARARAAAAGSPAVRAPGSKATAWTTLGGAALSGCSQQPGDRGDGLATDDAVAVACAAKLCPAGLEGTMLSLLAQGCTSSAPLLRRLPSSPRASAALPSTPPPAPAANSPRSLLASSSSAANLPSPAANSPRQSQQVSRTPTLQGPLPAPPTGASVSQLPAPPTGASVSQKPFLPAQQALGSGECSGPVPASGTSTPVPWASAAKAPPPAPGAAAPAARQATLLPSRSAAVLPSPPGSGLASVPSPAAGPSNAGRSVTVAAASPATPAMPSWTPPVNMASHVPSVSSSAPAPGALHTRAPAPKVAAPHVSQAPHSWAPAPVMVPPQVTVLHSSMQPSGASLALTPPAHSGTVPVAAPASAATVASHGVAPTPPPPPPAAPTVAHTGSIVAPPAELRPVAAMGPHVGACGSASTPPPGTTAASESLSSGPRLPMSSADSQPAAPSGHTRSPYSSRGWWEELAQARAERRGQVSSPCRDSFGSDGGIA
mmetsp:Transcript_12361/g.35071  ORF Transcript_12361/g.35071 Transcript_12361/m.35071 type:complete len:635 (-) Transcript_12361:37-1941(-)